jgi:hypothetical protein
VTRQPIQSAAPLLINHLAQKSQQWLSQWGEAEIALQGSRLNRLQGNVALLLPLQQSAQQLLFTQGGWHRDQQGSLFTLGVGQRHFTSAQGYWGYNLFVDYRHHGGHQRLGLGLEQRTTPLIWNLNGYLPLTSRRLVTDRSHWVRPARGLDFRIQYQPPQYPHWRLKLITERYWGTIAAAGEPLLQRHPTAVTVGVGYTPLPLVTADYGFKMGSGQPAAHQLQLMLHYHLSVPLAHQLDPEQVAAAHSLEGSRLALVPRNRQMVLEQQPKDEIQLLLQPERICQPVGSRATLAFQLRSTRPLEEWILDWRGDLLQHSAARPQINAAQDQASLILPTRAGTYRLQLVARNARGVVAYSNELWVVAEAVAVPANKSRAVPATKQAVSAVQSSTASAVTPPPANTTDPKASSQDLSEKVDETKNTPPTQTPDTSVSENRCPQGANALEIAEKEKQRVKELQSNIKKSCEIFYHNYIDHIKKGANEDQSTRKSLEEILVIKSMENPDESHYARIYEIMDEATKRFEILNRTISSAAVTGEGNPTNAPSSTALPAHSEVRKKQRQRHKQASTTTPMPRRPTLLSSTAPAPPTQIPGSSSPTSEVGENEDDWISDSEPDPSAASQRRNNISKPKIQLTREAMPPILLIQPEAPLVISGAAVKQYPELSPRSATKLFKSREEKIKIELEASREKVKTAIMEISKIIHQEYKQYKDLGGKEHEDIYKLKGSAQRIRDKHYHSESDLNKIILILEKLRKAIKSNPN